MKKKKKLKEKGIVASNFIIVIISKKFSLEEDKSTYVWYAGIQRKSIELKSGFLSKGHLVPPPLDHLWSKIYHI